jgi:phage antirepressor YoqD-like protein
MASKTVKTITVTEAAKLMGVTPLFLQLALRDNRFPFGTAVKMKQWAYYINADRLAKYLKGE